jgi:hypothetical protein
MIVPDGFFHCQFGYYDDEISAVRRIALAKAAAERIVAEVALAELKGKAPRKKQPE